MSHPPRVVELPRSVRHTALGPASVGLFHRFGSDALGGRIARHCGAMATLIISASMPTPGERNHLARRAARGELVRIARGVYVTTEEADGRHPGDVHRDLVRARNLTASEPYVFCGASAAALWNLPRVGAWPDRVEVLGHIATGGRSQAGIRRRSLSFPPELEEMDGLLLTSLTDTVVGLGRWESFANAVLAADAALRGLPRAGGGRLATSVPELRTRVDQLGTARGSARARRAVEFADGSAESPGESLSRVRIHALGLPDPELQVEFVDRVGRMAVDFFWRGLGLVGEFDGVGKYVDASMTGGRSAADVLAAEKEREERLRALGLRIVRWGWQEALRPELLRARLASAGLT